MRKFRIVTIISTLALALAGCGGGNDSKFSDPGTSGGAGGGGGGSTTGTAITVTSSVPSIPSDGSTSAEITALVRDATNNLVPGVVVTFSATSGGMAVTQATTDASGAAKATLSTAGDPSLRTITVTATAGSLHSTAAVQVVAGSSNSSVQMGSLAGSTFTPNTIGITSASLSAGGSTSLQVVLQKSDGTLYSSSADVTFTSNCTAQGLATINSPVTTTTGIASATYAAKGCSGTDVITATATVGSSPVSATGSVTVAAASIGSVVFESASFTNIALKGTGNSAHPESSTVIFQVLDQSGGPRANATVTFALNTSVGGITLSPSSGTSDATGHVQTVVQGGTVATTVRVTATVTSTTPPISTQSNLLTVTTGIPDQDSFSLAVQCPNVEALNKDGVQVDVTARLSDRFNNPVPNGTAVTFTTEGGSIASQCSTAGISSTDTTPSGACSVKWTSSNPRPASAGGGDRPGRSTVLATAIGEESFTDSNGNGSFDNGEAFADVGEPFLDMNEDGIYQVGEPIYDFNNNSTRDGPDGKFNGVLCLDTGGRCDVTKATAGIGASSLIIMSGSSPNHLSPLPPTALHVVGTSSSFSFTFADINDNPMPSGTTVTGTLAGTGLTIGDPSSFVVPCTTEPNSYTFTINASGPATGTLTLKIKVPSGLETIAQYPVSAP